MEYLKIIGLLFLVLSTQVTLGQVPQTMSYQAVLMNTDGSKINEGSYTILFRLYDDTTDVQPLWEESQQIQVTQGVISVILGSINPLDLLFDQQYWLGISIGNESELVPRIALTSSPYALRARSVAGGVNSFPAEGNVGIGVENPTEALEVEGNIRVSEKILAGAFSSTSPFIIEAPEGTERVRVDDNTGWVGIGTPNPGRNLEIYSEEDRGVGIIINNPNPNDGITRSLSLNGPGEMSAGIISYGPNRPNVGNHLQIYNQHGDNSVISFVVDGGESMRILDNGVVGIGERNPNAKLHIGGLPGIDGIRFPDNTLQTTAFTGENAGFGDGHSLDAVDGDPVDAVFVDNEGRVGVGTLNPGANLEIFEDRNGGTSLKINNPNTGDGASSGIIFDYTGGEYAAIHSRSSNFIGVPDHLQIINNHGGGSVMSFINNGLERMRITDIGYVGIGENDPQAKLHIKHLQGEVAFRITQVGGATNGSAGSLHTNK